MDENRVLGVWFSIVFYLTQVPDSKSSSGSVFMPWVKMPQLFHEKAGERVALEALLWLSPETGILKYSALSLLEERNACLLLTHGFICKLKSQRRLPVYPAAECVCDDCICCHRNWNITDKLHTPNRLKLT